MKEVTVTQMRKIDRLMISHGISLLQMMEHAGRGLAEIVMKLKPQRVTVLVGSGNNGGGGFVCARFLHNWGVKVKVVLSGKLSDAGKHHLKTIRKLKISVDKEIRGKPDVIVDALLGYNAVGEPRGDVKSLIENTNSLKTKVVSLDVPSGFDLKTGKFFETSFKKAIVGTIGKPKEGMVGNIKKLYVIDIGIPKEFYKNL